MEKVLSVSIGIPAYNEEANIKNLLLSLLSQKADNFELVEIIVISDKSTDLTVKKVTEVHDSRIKLLENERRSGVAASQNKIIKIFRGDILVILDGDVLPGNEKFLHYMVRPFYSNNKLGIVSNDGTPLPAKSIFEQIINFSVAMRHEMIVCWNKGDNIYLCHGRNRALSRAFADKFSFLPGVAEDAFSYLKCKELGFEFFYQPKAEIWYRSPQNLSDHLRQSVRFFQGNKMLENYFSGILVKKSFSIPLSIVLDKMIKYFFKNPLKFFAYLSIVVLANLKSKFTKLSQNMYWDSSLSSKTL